MVGVADRAATRPAAEWLRAAGYAHRDDPDSDNTDLHVFALRRADGRRLAHAHVVVHGGTWWHEHVAFRDLLRDDADLRRRYEEHKRALAGRHQGVREAYTDGKTGFVTASLHERRAGR